MTLRNLTRYNEIGGADAYLQSKILTSFYFEDLDTNRPLSLTSTSWQVTFRLSGCPLCLQVIFRLLWFKTPLVIRLPDLG